MRDAGAKAGLPVEAIGCLEQTTVEGTEELMKHKLTAVILATGGLGLVRAAYASGKPAFGVGPGNVPAFIEKSADVAKATRDILAGTCFDFGTICASEQSIVVDASIDNDVRLHLVEQGGYFLNQSQTDALTKLAITPQRGLNPKIVGKPASLIAEWAGFAVPVNTRCLIAEVGGVGRDFPLSIEKLSPILTYYIVNGLEEGSRLCDEILHYGGMGHTASIHTRSRDAALRYGELMPAARVVVNTPSTHGAIGFSTALAPSMTLGCGSWGGNVTSDNISPLHLMDIKRVAFETRPVTSAGDTAISPGVNLSQAMPASPPPLLNQRPHRLDSGEIAALVDRFIALRKNQNEAEPDNAPASVEQPSVVAPTQPSQPEQATSKNGFNPQPVDFVCEDDVKRAVARGEKIYINSKTIVTPAARELGDARDVFARS
jgi:acetaldehyde dehydrogenase (acetylating)